MGSRNAPAVLKEAVARCVEGRATLLVPQTCWQIAVLAMVRYAGAALVMTRAILRARAVDGRIVLADWLRGRFSIVPVKYGHIVRQVNG